MFTCQKCQHPSQKHFVLVLEGREVSYTHIVRERWSKTERKRVHSQGWEIEKEISVCSDCYEKHKTEPVHLHNSSKHVLHTQKS